MSHASREQLLERLSELGIDYALHEHPPLHTVEQSKALRGELPGGHIKNLFLRDKKRNLWLVTVLEDRPIDLKALRRLIDARGTLSFGNAELLREALGVEPGAVTPCALINDPDRRVSFVLDKSVLAHDPVNAHPLTNDATIALAPDDLMRFVAACGHEATVLDFDRAA